MFWLDAPFHMCYGIGLFIVRWGWIVLWTLVGFSWCTLYTFVFVVFTIAPPIIFEGKSLMGNLAAIDLFSDHVLVGDLITYQIRHRLHPWGNLQVIYAYMHFPYPHAFKKERKRNKGRWPLLHSTCWWY